MDPHYGIISREISGSEINLSSIQNKDSDIIRIVSDIYGKIQYDCTFNKGSMWKGVGYLLDLAGDLNPRKTNWSDITVKKIDIENTGIDNLGIQSILWDPPFISKKTDKPNRMMLRYGFFQSPAEMFGHFSKSIKEISRILKGGGYLLVKIQDVTDGSRRYFSHVRIANEAENNLLELRDIFIKTNMDLPSIGKSKNLSRANHCYWMVFVKTRRKIRNKKI